ncbi:MAG TPA: GAF domain-containing sensor histidine kinase [Longimicrobiaceae bacterium]
MEIPTAESAVDRHARELEVLTSVATALNASASLEEALRVALGQVADLLHLHTGWVWLVGKDPENPYLAAAQNLPEALSDHPERMRGQCYCLASLERGELDDAANVFTCSRLRWLTEGTAGLRFHASVPLMARGERVGVMNVASSEWRELSEEELRLLRIIGDMVGLGIERSRLFERSAEAGAAEERNRLAREIHDTLAQGLAATALQLETADALLEAGADPERVRVAVRQALELTRRNLEDARRSVLNLRPRPLQNRSLSEALRELVRERASADGPRLTFRVSGSEMQLPPAVESGLYRVAQEALANALRHAQASTVAVRLEFKVRQVRLEVEDDGIGLARNSCGLPTHSDDENGFGMVGMCERMRLLGGTLNVQSTRGEGTRLTAAVPLEESPS